MSGEAGRPDREAWVELASVTGIGDERFAWLLGRYGDPVEVLRVARDGGLRPSRELPVATVAALEVAARSPGALSARLRALEVWTLTPFDAAYPERLASLESPPPVLYGRGDPAALSAPRAVALVGTRRPTLAGRTLAARVAVRLVECNAVVVSGLAFGVDGAGHAATLEAGGRTVAVIGGGHAFLGPRAHEPLARRIAEQGGAVVAELPPDAIPTRGTFPRRNRIISALSDAVIVVEAPRRSGALITARLALEAGLVVLVAPGRPGDPTTAGCLALLRETPARPLVGLDELVVDLGFAQEPESRAQARSDRGSLDRDTAMALLGQAEAAVARAVVAGAGSPDLLAVRTGLEPSVVAVAVTLLQLRGWVQAFGPGLLPAGPLLVPARREP